MFRVTPSGNLEKIPRTISLYKFIGFIMVYPLIKIFYEIFVNIARKNCSNAGTLVCRYGKNIVKLFFRKDRF